MEQHLEPLQWCPASHKMLISSTYFDFTSVGIPYVWGDHISPMLQIKFNQATSPTLLLNHTAYTSHKTLGVHKVPASQSMKQIDTLILKSQHYSKVLSTNYIMPTETWIFYNTIYLPSITYPSRALPSVSKTVILFRNKLKHRYSKNVATTATPQQWSFTVYRPTGELDCILYMWNILSHASKLS